ncbi:MAG: tetratricopeptide repeat protein [Planctomycetota bacterium]
MRKTAAWVAFGIVGVVLVAVCVWMKLTGPDAPNVSPSAEPTKRAPENEVPPENATDDQKSALVVAVPPAAQPEAAKTVHPLLGEADEAVLAEGSAEVRSTAGPELAEVIRAIVQSGGEEGHPASLTIDYPLDATIFPPEIVPLTFLWHEPAEEADTWLIGVTFEGESGGIYVLSPGRPPPAGPIDPECISETNEVYQPTPHQARAKSWTPGGDLWAEIKRRSAGAAATMRIHGFRSSDPGKVLSRGRITITTSQDPVGAPIFYRDVPLAPQLTERGVIKPLGDHSIRLIAWRLRDISKPESRLLLNDVARCTNCHSFSTDGKTLGMDLDGPQGDKGAYAIAPITEQMVIEQKDVITWNSFKDKPKDHKTIGFLSQISPDGQYAVTTLNEALFVCNFLDYKFLQVFYPTRGILGYYSRATGEIEALPGADDPKYVHCDAVWSPDGDYLVFARAEAKDPYPEDGSLPERPNDPAETPIQYDLYRIPFDGGRGGRPEGIAGASNNGMSNTFPKVSPDGKWIVFVKCRNGQLMRPDSELWIVPASGGTARRMPCNTWRMNSWHSFSPNSRWMVFSSKTNTPYTQMFLTHIDEDGNGSPAVLIPNSTAANRAVNIPEFLNHPYDGLLGIRVPAIDYFRHGLRGLELVKKGMLDEALAEFDMAVKLQPDYLDGHVDAARVLVDKGMLDEATARLDKVLEFDPEHSETHFSLGVILARKGMVDEALAEFDLAVQFDSDHLEARVNAAVIRTEKGMLDEAMASLKKTLEIDPKHSDAHGSLGVILARKGMMDEALTQFDMALKLNPGHLRAHANMGRILMLKGLLEEATTHFQAALKLSPEDPLSHFDLASVLLARRMLDEAIGHFKTAVEIAPRFVDARLMLGNSLAAQGSFQPAIGQYEQVLAIEPAHPMAINDLAWLLAACPSNDVRDGARAVELIEPACKADGDQNPLLLTTLAAAYAEVGRFSEAVATATKARELVNPKDKFMSERIRRHLALYQDGKPCGYPQTEAPE